MTESKSKKLKNTKKEYEDALATSDPTKMSENDLEDLAKAAIKKFKSLSSVKPNFHYLDFIKKWYDIIWKAKRSS